MFKAVGMMLILISADIGMAGEPLLQQDKEVEDVEYRLPIAKSKEEYNAYSEIVSLQTAEETVAQSREFLAKYPASALRVAVYQNLVSMLLRYNRYAEAFEWGKRGLAEYPEHLMIMVPLASAASHQVLLGNNAFAREGEEMAKQALEFLGSGKLPNGYKPDRWEEISKTVKADVYQSLGVFYLYSDRYVEAAQMLAEASAVKSYDPYLLYLLGRAEYKLYQRGERKPLEIRSSDPTETKPSTLLEQIVRTYARAIILAEGTQQESLRTAIDYEIQVLTKAVPSAKAELARSLEVVREKLNMIAKPPAAATDRP
ncbi:MAG: hypothetical protein RMM17_00495 [Acidobacteriota bacterium]|nr:hypothetical protein [Blastocatellia bacterium]MDW8411145.1 hypothetical protein [Acidobacteriota bacterium]